MAKNSASGMPYQDIVKEIQQRQFRPVYLLMGEESYYIDQISDLLANTVLPEEERDFNQMVVYCTKETNAMDIVNMSKRYPMMSEFQVVIVKEAKNLTKLDDLVDYVQNPLNSTVLVICHKNGNVDKRKKLVAAVEKVGVVFESPKLKEYQVPGFITSYLKERNLTISQKAAGILTEYIGADLNRMAGELEKLRITLPQGVTEITPEQIERNIGVSKEFNNFELRDAIVNKDVVKANRIINYFASNPSANPTIPMVAMLFNLFADLMQAHYSPDKTESGIAQYLGMQPWQVRNSILPALKKYSALKVMQVIGKLREVDAQMKGIGKGQTTDADIMKELIYFILH